MNLEKEHIFKKLYYQIQPQLVGFAIYYLSDKNISAEIVNDTFLKIWEKWDDLHDHKDLKSYLFQAVKNNCLNELKKKKVTVSMENLIENEPFTPASDLKIIQVENEQKLQVLINHLPTRCKQIFILSRISGFKNREIAHLMSISEKTVENQMTKALKFLKNNWN